MTAIALVRWQGTDGMPLLGVCAGENLAVDLTAQWGVPVRSLDDLVQHAGTDETLVQACRRAAGEGRPVPVAVERLLLPVDLEELWGAGVTYERSLKARSEETRVAESIYDAVYAAVRPEIFFKAPRGRIAGPGADVGLRRDGVWHVPEPELTVVLSPGGSVFGYTVGLDLTTRDIEAENPLYLPQAKMFHQSASIGPAIVLAGTVDPYEMTVTLKVVRHGVECFTGTSPLTRMRRPIPELVAALASEWPILSWTGLMTGTGIVPPDAFALEDGDRIEIAIPGIGTLQNRARRIDASWAQVPRSADRIVRVDPRDGVAVALGELRPGMRVAVTGGPEITVRDPIPFGHKVALVAIEAGECVIKYGEVIGVATRAIAPGEHAHVHNIDSSRGRGDLARKEGQP